MQCFFLGGWNSWRCFWGRVEADPKLVGSGWVLSRRARRRSGMGVPLSEEGEWRDPLWRNDPRGRRSRSVINNSDVGKKGFQLG